MLEMIMDSLLDAAADTARLIPFLLLTYVLMEYMESRTEEKTTNLLAGVGRLGPLIGGALGAVPQCGFSAAASSLYAGGVISIGTLLAVFLSTSDEMLPIFISSSVPVSTILHVLLLKLVIGAASGFALDSALRLTRYRYKTEKRIHDLCEQEHCGCDEDGGILRSAFIHTMHIVVFIFAISFLITLAVEGLGEEFVAGFFSRTPVAGVLIAALIGLIPNCAASVIITQLYLEGLLGMGQMMAGLLVGAGVGLLVLFRTNRHFKENVKIAMILYAFGVFWGLLIEALQTVL